MCRGLYPKQCGTGKFIGHKFKIKIHSDTASLVVNGNYQGMIFTFFLHWMLDILPAAPPHNDHNQASATVEETCQ